MNFNSLVNKLEILEEARAGRFEKLFQTGYLKKAIEDKKIGVARPLVFEFIINFLKDKGMVPEGTAFAGSRYAAEAGEFIKNLVDSGVVKDEIADEFKQYMNENLGKFVQLRQQVRSRGKGENIGKTFDTKEDFSKFGKVKTAEEMAAEKQAKKDAEKARADDISPTSPIDAKSSIIEIVSDSEVPLDLDKIQKFFTLANKNQQFDVDQGSPNAVDLEFGEETPITKIVGKLGADKVEASIKASLGKALGLSNDEFNIVVHAPGYFEFESPEDAKPKTKSMRTGVDTQGYGMGTIAQDDSARRLANPFEDEEEIVKENAKPVVKFIANKDIKAKTFWQKMAQQEMYYR
jgi:hypothetical protein